MKKLIVLIFTSLLFSAAFAQQLSLQSVCQGLSVTPNTIGDFTQIKTVNTTGRQLKSSGKFIIAREGIMWKTLKPFPSNLVITKTAMIQTAGDGTKTIINGSDNQIFQNIAQTLSSVFAGDSKVLESNFAVDFVEKDSKSWAVVLTPKDSTIASVMQTLTLEGAITASNVVLNSLELKESSNNKIRYEFANQSYPKELTEDEKAYFKAD